MSPGMIAVYIESYLFPFLFAFGIYENACFLVDNADMFSTVGRQILVGNIDVPATIYISTVLTKIFLIVLNALIIWGFFIRRNLRKEPEGFLEIFVPVLGSFFYLLYSFVGYIPDDLNPILVPQEYFMLTTLIGIIFNLLGAVIASIATYNLRHSYSLFVQVRDIVTKGLYRYVRHPIYCGYLFSTIGFGFIQPRPFYLFVFICSVVVTVIRARIEERKLMAFSEQYQEYARHTPFILPLRLKK